MDKRAARTPDGAKAIIEYNIEVLYHLPNKYPCLIRVLEPTRKDLLKLLNFCKRHEPIIYKQKYTWFMANSKLTNLRDKTTGSVSNKRFNYWCSIGVINKLEQKKWKELTEINKRFTNKFGQRAINTFTVYKFTEKKLQEMEENAAVLLAHKITAGNISHDKLLGSGLDELANKVYMMDSKKSFEKKKIDFNTITEITEELIDEKGYTNKNELIGRLNWKREKLDRILNVHKEIWNSLYDYKAPNKEDVERYNLKSKSWIITRS